ncbi:MAG: hypothetical protein GY849_05875, partial [Deltaproteobacteria bacterium]|nr:hypothetical protein [Deltaproteobacteria bacterium]
LRDLDTGDFLDKYGNPSSDPTKVPVVYDTRIYFGYSKIGGKKIPNKVSALELGFAPTFYQFVDTIIEVKICIKVTELRNESKKVTGATTRSESSSSSGSWGWNRQGRGWWGHYYSSDRASTVTTTAPVNTAYTSKFSFSAEGSSLLRTKLVPVPVPAIFEERVRELMDMEKAERGFADEKERIEEKIAKVAQLKEGGTAAEKDELADMKQRVQDRLDVLKESFKAEGASDAAADKEIKPLKEKLEAIK